MAEQGVDMNMVFRAQANFSDPEMIMKMKRVSEIMNKVPQHPDTTLEVIEWLVPALKDIIDYSVNIIGKTEKDVEGLRNAYKIIKEKLDTVHMINELIIEVGMGHLLP